MVTPEQVSFADEIGQDGRWSRRKSGWGPIGESVIITEYPVASPQRRRRRQSARPTA